MCLKTWDFGVLGLGILELECWGIGICVYVFWTFPDRMAGLLFTQAHHNNIEWFLICSKASPVLLRAAGKYFTYLS